MRFLSLIGCMVFIGLVDWAILWALRFSIRHIQRLFVKVIG
jgi:hypothetical protein